MSTLEDIPAMTTSEYVIEVFRRTYRAGNAGQWDRADAVKKAVAVELDAAPGAASPNGNDGSYRVIERLAANLGHADIPDDLSISTIAKYRNVANAWPEERRVPQASYDAHRELVAKTYDKDRQKILRRLLSNSSRGYVTRADVRTYKSEVKPKVSTPFDRRVANHVGRLFKGELRPAPTASSEWSVIVDALDAALTEAKRELTAAKERA